MLLLRSAWNTIRPHLALHTLFQFCRRQSKGKPAWYDDLLPQTNRLHTRSPDGWDSQTTRDGEWPLLGWRRTYKVLRSLWTHTTGAPLGFRCRRSLAASRRNFLYGAALHTYGTYTETCRSMIPYCMTRCVDVMRMPNARYQRQLQQCLGTAAQARRKKQEAGRASNSLVVEFTCVPRLLSACLCPGSLWFAPMASNVHHAPNIRWWQ